MAYGGFGQLPFGLHPFGQDPPFKKIRSIFSMILDFLARLRLRGRPESKGVGGRVIIPTGGGVGGRIVKPGG